MNNSTTEHDTLKLITPFHSETTAHSNDTNISNYGKIPQISKKKIPYYRLGVSPEFCSFCNVLKSPNNSYQQTHHLELNRMVQTI